MEWKPYLRKGAVLRDGQHGRGLPRQLHPLDGGRPAPTFWSRSAGAMSGPRRRGSTSPSPTSPAPTKRPHKFGQTLAIEMKVRKLTPARLVLEYRMTDAETGELHTLGTSSHFSITGGRSTGGPEKGVPGALRAAAGGVWKKFSGLKIGACRKSALIRHDLWLRRLPPGEEFRAADSRPYSPTGNQ